MNYIDKYKLIWYAPMRNCTRALSSVFKEFGMICNSGNFDHSLPNTKVNEDITKRDYKIILSVRNPYARLVSLWNLNKIHTNKYYPFEEFVDGAIIRKTLNYQFYYHTDFINNLPDYIIHCEKMKDEIMLVPGILENLELLKERIIDNIENNRYADERTSLDKSNDYWKIYYNKDLANIIFTDLKEQFEMFGYDKDSWL